jgi:putative ABC transport system permease protein
MVAWHNLLAKPVQNGLTMLMAAMAITLMITVSLLSNGIHNGLVRATEPFDLIVGAKGSPNQLVLNTVFLQDNPIGNIDYSLYEKLDRNPLVAAAIPLAFGDNYQGYRIIGAGKGIFQHQIKTGQPAWLQLAAGHPFQNPFEAVVGAQAARELRLTIGDEFKSVHGLIPGGEAHNKPYRVVGILQPVQGPYDQAIIVDIDSIWEAHAGHGHDHDEAEAGEEHAADAGHDDHKGAVTAILVKPNGYGEAMRLYQQYQNELTAQMVFPAQVIVKLFSILGQGEAALRIISYAIIVMGLVIMALSLYWSALSRARERAVLRALGASAYDIFVIICAEAGILATTGAVLGGMIGHGIYAWLAGAMASKTAITITTGFMAAEAYIMLGGITLGLVAGIIPAVMTYRADIGQHL